MNRFVHALRIPGCLLLGAVLGLPISGLDLNNHVVGGGGGSSRTSRFSLVGTIGQPFAESGSTESDSGSGRSGFWSQTVRWLNSDPVAREDLLERRAGQGAHILASLLVRNDSATDLEQLQLIAVDSVSVGGGSIFRDGPFLVYEPLSTAPADAEDSFEYVVRDALGVTARGTVLIRLAGVPAGGPPNALGVETIAGQVPSVKVRFHGVAGRSYEVQFASEVSGQWTAVGRLTAGPDGNFFFVEPFVAGPRFYRIVEPNP